MECKTITVGTSNLHSCDWDFENASFKNVAFKLYQVTMTIAWSLNEALHYNVLFFLQEYFFFGLDAGFCENRLGYCTCTCRYIQVPYVHVHPTQEIEDSFKNESSTQFDFNKLSTALLASIQYMSLTVGLQCKDEVQHDNVHWV